MVCLRDVVVTGALVLSLALFGCSSGNEKPSESEEQMPQEEPTIVEEAPDDGDWELSFDATSSLEAESATTFLGVYDLLREKRGDLQPVTTLASQVVEGTKYAYLCKMLPSGDEVGGWYIVSTYRDLDGGSWLSTCERINLGNLKTSGNTLNVETLGGWTINEPIDGVSLQPEDASKAFEVASYGYDGLIMSPLATLGVQREDDATSYLILCEGKQTVNSPVSALYMVEVTEDDTFGSASFTNVIMFNMIEYVTPASEETAS